MHDQNDMHGRVYILEAEMKALQKERDTERKEYREDLAKLFVKIDELRADLAKIVPCSAPNACIRIEQELKEVKADVVVLNASKNRLAGERIILGGICTVIGSAVSGIIVYFSTK